MLRDGPRFWTLTPEGEIFYTPYTAVVHARRPAHGHARRVGRTQAHLSTTLSFFLAVKGRRRTAVSQRTEGASRCWPASRTHSSLYRTYTASLHSTSFPLIKPLLRVLLPRMRKVSARTYPVAGVPPLSPRVPAPPQNVEQATLDTRTYAMGPGDVLL